jgi:uncharacterized membrane protein (DUF485 family)
MTDSRIDGASSGVDYIAVEESAPFRELKRRQRSFVFPMAVAFLVWYFVYVLLSSFAPAFMAQPVFGAGQFVTTFALTMGYVAYANRRLDPGAEHLRVELERAERGEA